MTRPARPASPRAEDRRAAPEHGRPVALVTGGNRGLGREAARQLPSDGVTVILGSPDRERGEQAAAGIDRPGGLVLARQLNALTRLMAGELRAGRFLVNAVCPGWTDTDTGRGGRPVSAGAASAVWAAALPDGGPASEFFRDGHQLPWYQPIQSM